MSFGSINLGNVVMSLVSARGAEKPLQLDGDSAQEMRGISIHHDGDVTGIP